MDTGVWNRFAVLRNGQPSSTTQPRWPALVLRSSNYESSVRDLAGQYG
nr:hypothetical protein [Kibdelosporangium sp. MJ126-NF4]CTQ97615.1 hypothetical protein [Kibdelosporangium sp. MJ126-NF4]